MHYSDLKHVLIVGGSGGIGSALIRTILNDNQRVIVYGTYRTSLPPLSHERLRWHKVDASSDHDIEHLAKHLDSLDLIINASGLLHIKEHMPEKSIRQFTADFMLQNIQSNTLPTLYLAKHFSKQLKSESTTFFISLSARIGSIEDNQLGGWISYRCAKAALNMAIKTLSLEWRHKLPNCCVIAFHPGTTDTPLSKPFQKHVARNKLFTPDYVAQCLLQQLNQLTANDSGRFISFDGSDIPW